MTSVEEIDAISSIKLKLSIECSNLINKDRIFPLPGNMQLGRKSDPCCMVHIRMRNGKWFEVGRTEKIQNTLNPRFTTSIEVDFIFEINQDIRFVVYDIDDGMPKVTLETKPFNPHDHDLLGFFETTLGDIVGSRNCQMTASLFGKRGTKDRLYGTITILAEEISYSISGILCLTVCAQGLLSKDWFGKGDHYLVIKRRRADHKLETVHRTEVVRSSSDPTWKPMEIPLGKFNLGDLDGEIIFEVWDWNMNIFGGNGDTYLGEVRATSRQILSTHGLGKQYAIKKRHTKQPTKKRGIEEEGNFVQFLSGGCQINVIVGIDFTASNLCPVDPNSLHYIHPGSTQQNPYEQAISSILTILEKYDDDKNFEAYGFGGRLPSGQVSHCFPLSGNFSHHVCKGVEGVLAAYNMCLQKITLAGPTNFAEVIRTAHLSAKRAKEHPGEQYTILLMITDGVIQDWDKSVNAIIKCSGDPISIIIVGVGNADFSKMKELDSDGTLLTNALSGEKSKRDIVQFVSFNDLKNDGPLLAREVLIEIPNQFMSYMRNNKIKAPKPRISWTEEAKRSYVVDD